MCSRSQGLEPTQGRPCSSTREADVMDRCTAWVLCLTVHVTCHMLIIVQIVTFKSFTTLWFGVSGQSAVGPAAHCPSHNLPISSFPLALKPPVKRSNTLKHSRPYTLNIIVQISMHTCTRSAEACYNRQTNHGEAL